MKLNVKINSLKLEGNVKAYASINFDDKFAVTGLRVVDGKNGPFVTMPNRKVGNDYKDIAYPLSKEFRQEIQSAVLNEYNNELNRQYENSQSTGMTMA